MAQSWLLGRLDLVQQIGPANSDKKWYEVSFGRETAVIWYRTIFLGIRLFGFAEWNSVIFRYINKLSSENQIMTNYRELLWSQQVLGAHTHQWTELQYFCSTKLHKNSLSILTSIKCYAIALWPCLLLIMVVSPLTTAQRAQRASAQTRIYTSNLKKLFSAELPICVRRWPSEPWQWQTIFQPAS